MDPLQFSLFFAALVVAYVLVHLRLVRFETYLREIAGIKTLNERLKGLVDSMERVRVDGVEERVDTVHSDLETLIEAADRIERALTRGSDSAPAPTPFESPAAAQRIRSVVETRLLEMGYGNLHLLTDLSHANLEDEVEVQVECERGHMPCKGKVVTRNGAIRDVSIQTVVQSFP